MSKLKVIKDYTKLDPEVKQALREAFPRGFDKHLISFKGLKGKIISGIPFETDEINYFVKMTREQALVIYQGMEDMLAAIAANTAIVEDDEDEDEDLIIEEVDEKVHSISPEEMD